MEEPAKKYPPKTKPTIYQIVCWKCKRAHVTLYNLRDENGKKTQDYVCSDCKVWGSPEIGNVSRVVLSTPVAPSAVSADAKNLPNMQ